MSESGKQTITSSLENQTLNHDPPGCLELLVQFIVGAIGLLAFIVVTVLIFSPNEPDRPTKPTLPEFPSQPQPNIATFESSELYGRNSSIAVVLGGGNYEITYENTSDPMLFIEKYNDKAVFIADFINGKKHGQLTGADVIILVGTLDLKIGEISGNDSLYSNILSRGNKINAYFNFSRNPRAPPKIPIIRDKKRVIIVGELAKISFANRYQNSKLELNILDLNPSSEDEKSYREAYARYQKEKSFYRERYHEYEEEIVKYEKEYAQYEREWKELQKKQEYRKYMPRSAKK